MKVKLGVCDTGKILHDGSLNLPAVLGVSDARAEEIQELVNDAFQASVSHSTMIQGVVEAISRAEYSGMETVLALYFAGIVSEQSNNPISRMFSG